MLILPFSRISISSFTIEVCNIEITALESAFHSLKMNALFSFKILSELIMNLAQYNFKKTLNFRVINNIS
jgi:hypothetical protein